MPQVELIAPKTSALGLTITVAMPPKSSSSSTNLLQHKFGLGNFSPLRVFFAFRLIKCLKSRSYNKIGWGWGSDTPCAEVHDCNDCWQWLCFLVSNIFCYHNNWSIFIKVSNTDQNNQEYEYCITAKTHYLSQSSIRLLWLQVWVEVYIHVWMYAHKSPSRLLSVDC